MQIAEAVASNSKCNRAKVGAVIIKDKKIVATGYNGTPSGTCNDCEENGVTKPTVIHAELNAILNATTEDLKGTMLYVTLSPCKLCAAAIIQKGIVQVIYKERYSGYTKQMCGIDELQKNGIICEQIKQ